MQASWCYRGAEAGCRPAGAIRVLRLCAGGYGCRVPAWNGCRPAGSIRVLRLWAGGYGCSRGTDAAGQLVLLTR